MGNAVGVVTSGKLQESAEYPEKAEVRLLRSQMIQKLQIPQKPQLQQVVWSADLRERDAECAEDAAISSDSEVKFRF